MTFGAALDREHQDKKDDSDDDAHKCEQPEASDEEEDRERGRKPHSRDDEMRAMTIPSGICLTAAGSSSGVPAGVVSSCIYRPLFEIRLNAARRLVPAPELNSFRVFVLANRSAYVV